MDCSIGGCKRDTFLNGKCIFHCEKDGWTVKARSQEITTFWEKTIEYVVKQSGHHFAYFVFPTFPLDAEGLPYFLSTRGLTFPKKAVFDNAEFRGSTSFKKVTFAQGASFKNAEFIKEAVFTETQFSGETSFEWVQFLSTCRFSNTSFHADTNFRGALFNGNVSFQDVSSSGRFVFTPSSVDYLNFSRISFMNSDVELGPAEMTQLIFNGLSFTHSSFRMDPVKVKGNCAIVHSRFDGADIFGLDVSSAKNVTIEKTSFASSIFNNTEWGNIKRIKGDRDTFRQLKVANEKQGNYLDANGFYAMEMRAHRRELRNGGPPWENMQTRALFTIRDWLSEFSTNWVRPIVWFFATGMFFFLFMSFLLDYEMIKFNIDNQKLDFWPTIFDKFIFHAHQNIMDLEWNKLFIFMNPLESESKDVFPDYYILWLIYKVISVFLIYQFITALFRQSRR